MKIQTDLIPCPEPSARHQTPSPVVVTERSRKAAIQHSFLKQWATQKTKACAASHRNGQKRPDCRGNRRDVPLHFFVEFATQPAAEIIAPQPSGNGTCRAYAADRTTQSLLQLLRQRSQRCASRSADNSDGRTGGGHGQRVPAMNCPLPWRGQGTADHRRRNRHHPGHRHGGLGRQDQCPDAGIPASRGSLTFPFTAVLIPFSEAARA